MWGTWGGMAGGGWKSLKQKGLLFDHLTPALLALVQGPLMAVDWL
jgi:hypothetical protein